MDLKKINRFQAQTPPPVFTLAANGVCPGLFINLAGAISAESTLGEDVGPSTGPFRECARDDFFGVAQTVCGGRIDPVNSEFQCPMEGGDRLLVVLPTPAALATRATNGPSAEANRRERYV
jgi:hypothetical protein